MRTIIFILILCLLSDFAFAQNGTITNTDGKYGIFDKNHGVIVAPICDKIISKNDWNGMLFILKRENKYAYAYFRNLDSLGKFGYQTPQWEVSEFVFDELEVIANALVIRYKKNGKYGLIYIDAFWKTYGFFSIGNMEGLGELNSTEAIYDEPFWRNDDNIFHVKENGKYRFLELFNNDKKWINYTYNDWFDTVPLFISTEYRSIEPFYRIVKKNNSWGVVKINTEKKALEYIVPCNCDTVLYSWYKKPNSLEKNLVFLCEKRVKEKAILYDGSRDSLSINFIDKPPVYHLGKVFHIDTIPNEKEETHKKYVLITLGSYDIQSMIFSNKGQCIVDMQSGNTTFYIDDYNTTYKFFFGYHGIIIEKQIKTESGTIIYEYIEYETGEQKMTLKSQKNISYRARITQYHKSTNDYLLIEIVKEKKGEKQFTYKYYYDFRFKKFFNGRCKGCQ